MFQLLQVAQLFMVFQVTRHTNTWGDTSMGLCKKDVTPVH